jgi:hypothetical protein
MCNPIRTSLARAPLQDPNALRIEVEKANEMLLSAAQDQ